MSTYARLDSGHNAHDEENANMSWKPEVIADSSGKWCGNALRFATQEEAEASAANLAMRWTLVRDYRAVECDDPVNYRLVDGRLVSVGEAA
jgi:hypothetical protein